MRLKALLAVTVVLVMTMLWPAMPVHSQDLGAELAAALEANEQAVETIQSAETATSPSVARALVLQAVSEAQSSRASLQIALALVTTDEQRSRIEALITHLDAAINAGLQAQTASDETISSIVDAVRGELVEALRELEPFAPEVSPREVSPAPSQLPKAGEGRIGAEVLSLLAASGLISLLIGLRLRPATRAI